MAIFIASTAVVGFILLFVVAHLWDRVTLLSINLDKTVEELDACHTDRRVMSTGLAGLSRATDHARLQDQYLLGRIERLERLESERRARDLAQAHR